VDIAVVHSDRSPGLFSGYFDSNYIHDFELHATSGFTTWIIGQVNALALDTLIGLLAFISEGNIIALEHVRVQNPVTVIPLNMRCHFQYVTVDKLLVLF